MLNISGLKLPMVGGSLVGGSVYFVDSGASGANDGNLGVHPENSPLATLDGGVNKCTASNGDFVILMPGHAETLSATVSIDVAGITIIGIGNGTNRPVFTCSTTGTDDVFDISADNVKIENILMTGASAGTNETLLNISGDYVEICGSRFTSAAKNLNMVTIPANTHYVNIHDNEFVGLVAGVNQCILFENITNSTSNINPIIKDNLFNFTMSAGCDDGVIVVSHSSGATVGMLIENCNFIGIGDAEAAVNAKGMAATRCTGLMKNVAVHTADATDAFVVSNMLGYVDVYAVEAGARPFGAKLGSGMAPLLTSAA